MADKRLLWLLLPLAGLLELAAHFHFARAAPRIDDWHAVRQAVAELRQQDDLVVVAPYWAEPNARHAFGDALMPLEHVARPDESRFRRALEVGILGQRAPELAGWRLLEERRQGGFLLRVLENPAPAEVAFDFLENIQRAAVFEGASGRSCPWNGRARLSTGGLHGHPAFPRQRFECGGGEEFFVGVTVIEDQDYRPRRCVWAHPVAGGPLVIRFAEVPLGRVIRGYSGLPWTLERERKGRPVTLQVRAGGRDLGATEHRDGDGWKPFELSTGELAGRRVDVEIRVRSETVRHRQFCFQADTR